MNKDELISGVVEHVSSLMGPRVTLSGIEANIVSEHFFTAYDGATAPGEGIVSVWHDDVDFVSESTPLSLLTFCVLVLRNGFTVTGESACVSPENFDAEIGRQVARENAINKVWPLLGYELKTKLQGTAD